MNAWEILRGRIQFFGAAHAADQTNFLPLDIAARFI
jgi:hypothetical protein